MTEISKDNYRTAAIGATAGGAAALGADHVKLSSIAKQTVKAMTKTGLECDTFVNKHQELFSKAYNSKRGCFGKINEAIKTLTGNSNGTKETIEQCTSSIIDSYEKVASSKVNRSLPKQQLEKEVDKLRNNLMSKDILVSLKDASKVQTAFKFAAAVVAGTLGAFVVKEIASSKTSDNLNIKVSKTAMKTHQG